MVANSIELTSHNKPGRFRGQSVLGFERRCRDLTFPKAIVKLDVNCHDVEAAIASAGPCRPFILAIVETNGLKREGKIRLSSEHSHH